MTAHNLGQGRCRSCGKDILWAKTRAGRFIPLNPEANPRGNVVIRRGVASVEKAGTSAECLPRYVSHFATCGQADMWRRPAESEALP